MTCEFAELDGAYVLGALPAAERLAFEQHLTTCEECSRAVRQMAGLPGLLARVDTTVLDDPAGRGAGAGRAADQPRARGAPRPAPPVPPRRGRRRRGRRGRARPGPPPAARRRRRDRATGGGRPGRSGDDHDRRRTGAREARPRAGHLGHPPPARLHLRARRTAATAAPIAPPTRSSSGPATGRPSRSAPGARWRAARCASPRRRQPPAETSWRWRCAPRTAGRCWSPRADPRHWWSSPPRTGASAREPFRCSGATVRS